MENITTPVAEEIKSPENRPPKKKKKNKKIVKRIITAVVVLAILGGIAFGMFKLFGKEEENKEIWSGFVSYGSIQSTVTGYGVTMAKDSASITLASGGVVSEVFVTEGQVVYQGDPLYVIDSAEAKTAVDKAQEAVLAAQKRIDDLNATYAELTVKAPFKGKLMDVAEIKVGDEVAVGTRIATIVDDSRMIMSLYFSYAYENDIKVGQSAQISVPSTMNQITGRVDKINYVKRISAEGSMLFEVVLSVENPGTLTEGMGASAILKASSGEEIYAYEPGELKYNNTAEITAKAGGKVLTVNLLNYNTVSSGTTLVHMDGSVNDSAMDILREEYDAAQEALLKAEENMGNFSAVSPLTGTVLACSLVPGEEVAAGRVAISIADTSVMTVEVQVDQLNISYVKAGMYCDVIQYGRDGQQYYMGIVESVSLEGKYENGVSYFPAIIKVDNYEGTLAPGVYVDYSLVAAQSDNCLIVPNQAVKYLEEGTCLFVKSDTKPENAIDPGENTILDIPEGYYVIPVTVGLSDNTSAEITEGAEEGMEVFIQYMTNYGDMYGGW